MHPILLDFGRFQLHSWGLMLAIAIIVGSLIAERRAPLRGIVPQQVLDLTVVIVISAVIGARIPYVIEHWSEFRLEPVTALYVWRGGMVFYGGFLFSFFASIVYLRRRGIPVWRMADVIAPSIGLGLFFGRIGCFLNGCCYGKPTGHAWGVVFPEGSPAYWDFPGISLHPTQLYSSAAGLLMFVALLRLDRRPHYDGYLFWTFALMYGMWRFAIDFIRSYPPQTYLVHAGNIHLTVGQLASLLVIMIALAMMRWLKSLSEPPCPERATDKERVEGPVSEPPCPERATDKERVEGRPSGGLKYSLGIPGEEAMTDGSASIPGSTALFL
jgi:phosphatidylglycerol:prolipoprotein diacylglycerol transferase